MRHLVNFGITAILVWIFQLIGWIQIQQQLAPFDQLLLNQLLVAGIIGLIFTMGVWLTGLAFALLVLGSCGIGCLLFPLYYVVVGPVGFWLILQVLPGWVTMTDNIWLIILMGLIIIVIRIPESKIAVSINSTRRTRRR